MTPQEAFGVDLFGLICCLFLVLIRLWVFFTSSRIRTFNRYGTEICVVLAFLADLAHGCVEYWRDFREMKMARLHPGQVLDKYVEGVTYSKLYFLSVWMYTAFLWLVKGSFLFMYWELEKNMTRKMRICLYIVTAYVMTTFVANVLMKFLWCRPLSSNWSTAEGHCNIAISFGINTTTAVFNVTSDLSLIIFFVTMLYTLDLKKREFYASIFVVCIGGLTVIAASIRYGLILNTILTNNATLENVKQSLLWTRVEVGLSLLAACLPVFRVFLRRHKDVAGVYSTDSGHVGSHMRSRRFTMQSKHQTFDDHQSATEMENFRSDQDPNGSGGINVQTEFRVDVESTASASDSVRELWPEPTKPEKL